MLPTELEPGSDLDGFRIEARLHSGGMAVIYRVSRPDLAGPAVMKVPRLGQGEPAATIVSFEVEMMMLEALKGGPVPLLYAAGELTRSPYLVMAEVEGGSLDLLAGAAPLPVEQVYRFGAALARAVQALHEREVIHLDLKPSNVMVRPDGSVVLLDLGLAHHASLPDLLAEEFRRPLGSAPYMSPEQVLGVRDEARSDIFATGVILYQLATGHLPFGAPSHPAGLRKRLRSAPPPPRALRPDLPAALQEIIFRCLEVRTELRYPNAAQLAFDLQNPAQVALGARAHWTRRQGLAQRLVRWALALGYEPEAPPAPAIRAATAPVVMVAVATAHSNEREQDAIRREALRFATALPLARIACVTVVRPAPALGTASDGESAPRVVLAQRVRLQDWAERAGLPKSRLSFHVLEANDAASALLDYAEANRVEHILLGAPPPALAGRAILPTVAARVVAESPCSVTVIRARQ